MVCKNARYAVSLVFQWGKSIGCERYEKLESYAGRSARTARCSLGLAFVLRSPPLPRLRIIRFAHCHLSRLHTTCSTRAGYYMQCAILRGRSVPSKSGTQSHVSKGKSLKGAHCLLVNVEMRFPSPRLVPRTLRWETHAVSGGASPPLNGGVQDAGRSPADP